MRYLYGDSSAFPLNQNFIDTLVAATDCAVALLTVDEALARSASITDRACSAAISEIADIDQLVQRVGRALGQRDHLSNATAKVVEQVEASVQAQFDKAKDGIVAWRDRTIRKSREGCGPADIMAPIHRFMVAQELPYTAWGLRWKGGRGDEPVQAQVYAIMQRGLTATLSVAIPDKHTWSEPVRVRQLAEGASIKMLARGWLGKEKVRDEPLEKYFITRITRTSDSHMFVVSRKPKDPSEGLKFVLRDGEQKRITVVRIDEDDQPVGDVVPLSGDEARLIARIWQTIEETIADLVQHRHQLLAASMFGTRVTELETPAPIATAIIQSIAPLVREVKSHSRTPGELQLKRDLGDGRREELFIDEAEIVERYAGLSAKNQALFAPMGLSHPEISTSEVRQSRPAPSTPSYDIPTDSLSELGTAPFEPTFETPSSVVPPAMTPASVAPPPMASAPPTPPSVAPSSVAPPPASMSPRSGSIPAPPIHAMPAAQAPAPARLATPSELLAPAAPGGGA
ncbi:MAG: hypothetical protein KC731_38670, partial [Myxococcales bacterium]|nr:hypothetical protein [Myxococcales bacterium]